MDRAPTPAPVISGRSAFLRLLADEGIRHLFGNPGTTELAIMEAMSQQSAIDYVLGLQESVVVGMADGYARASNQLAACNVHVAPGLGNAMGALYNAKFYGSPVIDHGRPAGAGPRLDGADALRPAGADRATDGEVGGRRDARAGSAAHRASRRQDGAHAADRAGVHQPAGRHPRRRSAARSRSCRPAWMPTVRPSDAVLERLADRLLAARNPVLIAGHELATRDALREAAQLAEILGAPVWQQTVPYAAHFLSEHPAFVGPLNAQPDPGTRCAAALRSAGQSRRGRVAHVRATVPSMPCLMACRSCRSRSATGNWARITRRKSRSTRNVKETLRALMPVLRSNMNSEQNHTAAARLAEVARNNWSVKRAKAGDRDGRRGQTRNRWIRAG